MHELVEDLVLLNAISSKPTSLRMPAMLGLVSILASVGGLSTWSCVATLASAVIVPGTVVVETGRKSIQHQDGGVIKSIDVIEGEHVAAGQSLVTLDGNELHIASDTLRRLLAMNTAERLRLAAERSGSDKLDLPSDAAEPGAEPFREITDDERRLFQARRASLESKIHTLISDGEAATQTAANIDTQIRLQRTRVILMREELEEDQRLLNTHDASRQHVLEITRSLAELGGETEELISRADEARQRVKHNRLEALRTAAAFMESVDTDMQEAKKARLELVEKLNTVSEQIARLHIITPVSGRVVNLSVHTVGGVVAAGVTLLEIVPDHDPLQVEAEIRPEDVDNVVAGMPATISLTGFIGQKLPRLNGVVVRVSADRVDDPTKAIAFFRVGIAIPLRALSLLGSHPLRPGEAVTVMLCNGKQTPLQYLLSPVLSFFSKAMHA